MNYYDIHTHILPGVDDGARDLEESVAMLRMAWEEGITHLIATPHFSGGGGEPAAEELEEKRSVLQKEAWKISPRFTVGLGNELLNGPAIVDALQTGRALTLAGTRYILVEFLPGDSYHTIYQALRNYMMHGYIPVVAHMERYGALAKQYGRMDELRRMGVYFQMNTESLAGNIFQRKAAYHRRLVTDGYIQFLGSDMHRMDRRVPLMQKALGYVPQDFWESRSGKAVLEDNPKRMLKDEFV
ncbi:MAG: protein tyrosine phosphatase [Oscillospiraceae bacterium]|nr:protein tyrosine phosphatase [Oscillospiraceae bacterium]